ncbi:LysR substrate binding domain-containing protein [Variovorax sp. YR216]|nr:LysR substrate binding domain-containing protein [Variovorax sp. YR216]
MRELIELTQAELTARANKPKGRLRIAAPYAMANGTFPNLLADFMGYYPEVSLSLHLVNEVDLVGDAIDVQLRFGPILDENVIVRRLLQMPMVVCASPGYWKKRGMPLVPDDLRKHDALTLLRQGLSSVWRFESEGETVNVSVRSVMEATEVHPLIQVALRGFGVIYAPVLACSAAA